MLKITSQLPRVLRSHERPAQAPAPRADARPMYAHRDPQTGSFVGSYEPPQRPTLAEARKRSPGPGVPSPCINVCRMVAGQCLGCSRTLEEIGSWAQMTDAEKLAVWARLGAG